MFNRKKLTSRERFLNVMEYKPVDRAPNHEAGVWSQTLDRWVSEGLNQYDLNWDWFTGTEYFDMDPREFIDVNYGMMPCFTEEVIEKTERYEIKRNSNGQAVLIKWR